MKIPRFLQSITILFLLIAAQRMQAQTARPELRAFWADGFNPGYKTPQEVDILLQRLHNAHCNAIFAQMRKRGDAYYASHYEPWATDDAAHFDALAYLVQKAHALKPPIAVHAWINTCAVGHDAKNPLHITNLHPDWMSVDTKNNYSDDEGRKIDPGNPDAADWTFRIYLDVVRHYSLDGIHFDFVRYGAPDKGYNPVSVARFEQQIGSKTTIKRLSGSALPDPEDPYWKQWRRDQVSALVRKVYAHAVEINPKIVVSAATIAWGNGPKNETEWFTKSAAMNRVYQDWQHWLKEGILDIACPMTYFQAQHSDWQKNWSEFVKNHQYKRRATIAVGNWMNTIPETLNLMQIAREPSAKGKQAYGIMLYSYGGTNISETRNAQGKRTEKEYDPSFYAMLSQPSAYAPAPPFASDVPIPPLPWKIHPKQGCLKGFVLTPKLDAIDGATVTARKGGETYRTRTDGTGFYAFIDLPPGNYAVRVGAPNAAAFTASATVTAGQVTTLPFTSGNASVPPTSLASLQTMPLGTLARLDNLRVTLGSDTFPGNVYAVDAEGKGIRLHLASVPNEPYLPGDVISASGTLQMVDGERALEGAAVKLTDLIPERDLALPLMPVGGDLMSGVVANGVLVKISGVVLDSDVSGFRLADAKGTIVHVPFAGLKDFGVEAMGLSVTPPPISSHVVVTGIVASTVTADGHIDQIRLRIRTSEDLTILPSAAASLQNPLARRVVACFFRPFPLAAPEPLSSAP